MQQALIQPNKFGHTAIKLITDKELHGIKVNTFNEGWRT